MNTKDLEYFLAMVKYKNYTYVAKQFLVSQPAITQAIQRLEREFGAKLIEQDRVHHQTTITRAGKLLYKNAQTIQSNIALAHREIEQSGKKKIRFGLPPIIGAFYFPQAAAELLKKGYLSRLKITEAGSAKLLSELTDGNIDVALIGSPRPISYDDLEAVHLGERPFNIIVSPENPLAQRKSISFAELNNVDFIGMNGNFVHPQAFEAFCQHADVKPNIIYSTPDISWLKSIVRANLGIGFLVKDAVNSDDGVVCLAIEDPLPERFNVSVVIRKGYVLTDDEKEFIEILSTMNV